MKTNAASDWIMSDDNYPASACLLAQQDSVFAGCFIKIRVLANKLETNSFGKRALEWCVKFNPAKLRSLGKLFDYMTYCS